VSRAWSLLGKVTVTLGRGLGQARYEYLWKSSLVGVAAWKSSSTSERLHSRLGSHLDEEVAPAVVVDTREALLQAGILQLRSVDLNPLQVVDTREAPLEADDDPSSD